jgi:tetratricopeptide (TPR) repeat protein
MRNILFILLLLCSATLFAQSTVVATTTQFIVDKKYTEANQYLDSVLKADKNNVDALMMKGNVILNKELMEVPSITISSNTDEDLYRTETGSMDETQKVIPAETANKVAALWKQCLKIDNTRLDIHKGLCTLYAMALMKNELKAQLAELLKVETVKDETAYSMAEYARKLKERGKFNDAMEVYKFIAAQFPNLGGIRGDIGSEYFYNGDLKPALQWLDSALTKSDIDETTYLNAAFIYSELAYFDMAQKTLDDYSKKYERRMNRFYLGLRQFANMDTHYVETLNYFISVVDSNAYYDEVKFAKQLLVFQDSFSIAAFRWLARSNLPEYYRVFIFQRGLKQFRNSCEPHIEYGAFNILIKNYSAAVQFLEEGEHCGIDTNQTDYWRVSYAYALLMTGQKDKALSVFYPSLKAAKAYWNHSANYFSAKILMEKKREAEAKPLLESIVNSSETTKYKTMATALLAKMKK